MFSFSYLRRILRTFEFCHEHLREVSIAYEDIFLIAFIFYAEYERTVLFPYNAQVDTAAKFVQDIIDKAKTEAAKKLNSEQIVSFSADIFFVFVFVLWHC